MSAVKTTMQKHPLAGMLFHTYDAEGVLRFQGEVQSVFDADGRTMAMCQLFSFIDGTATDVLMYDVAEMVAAVNMSETKFKFYDSDAKWLAAYRKYSQRKEAA